MTYRYRVAVIFLSGFFIDCVNIFMSAVALPSIARELQVSTSNVAWVANAYMLGLTLIMPLSTWLAGRFGSRALLTLSMLLFSGAAWMCGLAGNFHELVLWRFVQGLSGGLLIPVGQALTFNLFHGPQRAKISTLIMTVALIAPALSPTLGGIIVDNHSWRGVFYCTLPVSLLAACLSWLWVREPRAASVPRPDISGLLLISLALGCALTGMSLYDGDTPVLLILLFILAGVIFALLYRRHHRQTRQAIVDLSLLDSQRLRISLLIYYAIPGVFTGVNLLNMFFLQDSLHFSARLTGMLMILYAAGAFIAILICGRLYSQVGAPRLFRLGMWLHGAGIATLFWVDTANDLPLLVIAYCLMGLGGGIGANTAQTTSLMDFEGDATHKGSVIWNINRQMSFSLGAALFLMIYQLLAGPLASPTAYHLTFVIAALLGLLPLLLLRNLDLRKTLHAQTEH